MQAFPPLGKVEIDRRANGEEQHRDAADQAKEGHRNDPAVVTVFSVLDETDPPAIVMEFVEGFALDRFAAQLNFEQKARLLREVARGLSVAHARGLIHRVLKPDNVIVGLDLRPRILDFGLALSLEEASRQGRESEGTPLYASPEQAKGESLSPRGELQSVPTGPFHAAPVGLAVLSACRADEDAPHGLCCGGKKMAAILPSGLVVTAEPQPGFMHQRGGLQGLARRFSRHLGRGQLTQLLVNQRQQLIEGMLVAFADAFEDQSDVAHVWLPERSAGLTG